MKLLCIVFLVACVNSYSITNNNDLFSIDNEVKSNRNPFFDGIFELIRYLIKNGNTEYDIPVLDPFHFPIYEAEVDLGNILRINISFTAGVISGLSSFNILQSEFLQDGTGLDIDILFPNISFRSEYYKMKGSVFEVLPLNGEGVFEIIFQDFEVSSKIYLKQADDTEPILIDKLAETRISLRRLISNIEFDKNLDNIGNAVIEDIVPLYLNRFSNYIIHTFKDSLVNIINSYLNKVNIG